MTRETKIGLLVGLAFIIVIGILLSDHMTSTTQPPQATLTGAADNVRDGINTPASRDVTKAPLAVAPPVVPQQQVPTQEELAGRGKATQRMQIGPSGQPLVIQDRATPQPLTPGAEQQPLAVGPQPVPNSLQDVARQHGEELVDRQGNPIAPAEGPGRPREYKAEAGDSLSKMAAKFFGSNTRANRELIIKVNPSLQQDPNKIVVGRTYLIPTGTVAPAPAPASPAPAAPSEAAAPGQYWYTVRENDNLWKIADEQLGNGSAWVQIKELNKDVLKNGETLHTNMRLRLPSKPIVSASAN